MCFEDRAGVLGPSHYSCSSPATARTLELNEIAVARLDGNVDDIALGVEIDANEVPGAVGKFENEACDRYAVVLELALSNGPAEGLWITCRILGEVRYRNHSVAGGIELKG